MATNDNEIAIKKDTNNDVESDTDSDEDLNDFDIISLDSQEDLNEMFSEEEIKAFNEEVKTMQKKIKVVCGGPTGVGKSTLLNGLMGVDEYSDESDHEEETSSVSSFNVQDSLDRGTLSVASKTFTKNEIEVTLFDTPGLEGCNDADDAYLKEIKEKCADFDLFLYCINCTETRATELFDEKSSLVKFTRLFGVELWNNAVIVLTQANALEANLEEERQLDSEIDVKEAFQEKITEWRQRIRKELQNMGVRKKKVTKIPILPAGTAVSPDLPGHSFWLSQIFEKVTDRMKYKAKMAYLQFSSDRLLQREKANKAAIASQKIGDQPFVVSRKIKAEMAGVFIGAGIGATVGALALGIPTFGVLAGVGVAVGGMLGAAIGGSSGLSSAMAFQYFKKKRLAKQKKKKHT